MTDIEARAVKDRMALLRDELRKAHKRIAELEQRPQVTITEADIARGVAMISRGGPNGEPSYGHVIAGRMPIDKFVEMLLLGCFEGRTALEAEQRPQVTDEMVNRAASCMYEAFHGKSLKGYLIDARLILEAALEAEQ